MADRALRELWKAVRQDFDRAIQLLPSPVIEEDGSVARLIEWLDHNELGLALDELEALGDVNQVPPDYWRLLATAAQRMGLLNQCERLKNHLS
jgi:hypothetical protein